MKKRYKASKRSKRSFGKTVNRTHKFNVSAPRYVIRGGTRL